MSTPLGLDPWLASHLVCPRDREALAVDGRDLACPRGHRYPVVDGVPVMLIDDAPHTIAIAADSVRAARSGRPDPSGLYLETLSLSDDEKHGIAEQARTGGAIDPVAAYLVAATNGLMYRHLIGQLCGYPIPILPMAAGHGARLLDVGCSWGRWTLAAAAAGYEAVGVDPSLGAVMAARRVAAALGRPARYVVADARYLPFAAGAFDAVYSYSVIQHFSRDDAGQAVAEAGRVLRPGGEAVIQMPTRFGIRCLYHQVRRGFHEGTAFDVRYWTLPALRRLLAAHVGPARFEVDCYFGIGLQASDAPLMPPRLRTVLGASEVLKRVSRRLPPLVWVADSVLARATRMAVGRG